MTKGLISCRPEAHNQKMLLSVWKSSDQGLFSHSRKRKFYREVAYSTGQFRKSYIVGVHSDNDLAEHSLNVSLKGSMSSG